MKKQYIYSLLFLFVFVHGFAQQTPASSQTDEITIVGATAHIGNGAVIENALLRFSNGKITHIGETPSGFVITEGMINAKGKHIYPGFIIMNSTLGLGEVDAVRASLDYDEIGAMLPHIRSIIAYNAESKVVESMRPNGILMGQVTPRGGVISGTSSVVQFDAWNWEDAAYKSDDGIHLQWPRSFTNGRWWLGEDPGAKPNKNYASGVEKIADFFDAGKRYLSGNQNPRHLPYEALNGLFDGSKNLYIHARDVKEITDAIDFCTAQGIKQMVLVNGHEALKVADLLVKHNIPVILDRAHRHPGNEHDDYDLPYKMAKLLVEKGILVSIGMEGGGMERMNSRNLPFYAGTHAGFGLSKEEALQLITLNPAKIMGIDAQVGTLEVGKDATLFISKGDALDMMTNILSHAFIQGRQLSLESHHTKLAKRYSEKYEQQK